MPEAIERMLMNHSLMYGFSFIRNACSSKLISLIFNLEKSLEYTKTKAAPRKKHKNVIYIKPAVKQNVFILQTET